MPAASSKGKWVQKPRVGKVFVPDTGASSETGQAIYLESKTVHTHGRGGWHAEAQVNEFEVTEWADIDETE